MFNDSLNPAQGREIIIFFVVAFVYFHFTSNADELLLALLNSILLKDTELFQFIKSNDQYTASFYHSVTRILLIH